MSAVEQTRFSPVVPDEWQEKYIDLKIKTADSGHDYLYGIDKQTNSLERLPWKPLDQSIKESFGYESGGFFPGLRAENEMLRQHNELLVNRLNDFQRMLSEEKEAHQREVADLRQEMADMEQRFNTQIQELEAKLPKSPSDPNVVDIREFREVRRWEPKRGDTVPVREAGRENVLTVDSVNPEEETVRVRNSNGQLATMPLAKLAEYWNAEQIRKRSEAEAMADDTSLRGRFRGAYSRLIRRRTEAVPVVMVNEDGETIVTSEEREVDDRRTAVGVVVGAAALIAAGVIGYEIGKSNEPPQTAPATVIRTIPRPLPSNVVTIGKERYKVLLNDEKKLGAVEANNAQLRANNQELKETVHDLRSGNESYGGSNYHTETLNYYGDTVWSHVQRYLERKTGRKPNVEQIRKLTSKVLSINGLRWQGGGYGVDAHRLPVGFNLRIPNDAA